MIWHTQIHNCDYFTTFHIYPVFFQFVFYLLLFNERERESVFVRRTKLSLEFLLAALDCGFRSTYICRSFVGFFWFAFYHVYDAVLNANYIHRKIV